MMRGLFLVATTAALSVDLITAFSPAFVGQTSHQQDARMTGRGESYSSPLFAQESFENDALTQAQKEANKALKNAQQILVRVKGKADIDEAAAVGAAIGGAILGAGLDVVTGNADQIPLEAAAVAAGAAALAATTQDNVVGKAARVGGLSVTNMGKSLVKSAIARIQAAPRRLADFLARKAQDAVEEVKLLPTKLFKALQNKAEETVQNISRDIQAMPGRMADAVQRKAMETIESIKAAPQRFANDMQDKFDETMSSMGINMDDIKDDTSSESLKPRPPITPPPDFK